MSPPLQITEDTPPDMLAGSMDLCVVLPNGKDVRMSVERSTPMMDLLVQVTTANKISPAGHVIQAIGERGVMPYKPSTPIGALDTWTIYIVPKNQVGQLAGRKGYYKSSVTQPFEQTFRLQVHLPRNQLYVSRISPKTRVSDILRQVCSEKNLDPSKYSLRHPVNLDQVLNASCSLAEYKLQEVALVSNRQRPVSVSTVDIMALQQHHHPDNFNVVVSNHRSCEGSLSSGSLGGRSLSPTRSDGSSASPPPLVPPVPHRPLRKRRPAPKPPVNNNNNLNNNSSSMANVVNKNNINGNPAVDSSTGQSQGATVICHSRNSSDSSGYHEASVLSESPESTNNSLPDSLPRRSKLPSNESNLKSTSNVKSGGALALSRSLSNLSTAVNSAAPSSIKTHSTSSTSLIAIGRKKKAAPAPPMARSLKMSSVSEERQKDICSPQSSLVPDDEARNKTSSRKSSTLPASIRVSHPDHSEAGSSSSSVCAPDTVDDITASSHLCPSFDLLKNTPSDDEEKSKLADWRNTGSVGLQSLQVLRSILPQLNNSQDSISADNDDFNENRNSGIRVASDLQNKFERSHSEEVSSSSHDSSYRSQRQAAPAVSFATWNERPKRQVSIKTDRDYTYGINKLKSHSLDERDTTEPKQSIVNFSSDIRQKNLDDKPDIIKHSTADLSHVPVVRAVELKKKPYFSSSCVDVTDLGRCGFFHGRSYENLTSLDNAATFGKSSTLKPSAMSTKESSKSQQTINSTTVDKEETTSYNGVNSLLRKFGQQRPTSTNRPVSCYLYGSSSAYDNSKPEENNAPRQSTGNTSRVMLNSEKRFTSVVGINNELNENTVTRKEFTNHYEKPSSRVMVNGTPHDDDKFVNNSKEAKNSVNSSLEFIKAQSKISSGGFVPDSPPRQIETVVQEASVPKQHHIASAAAPAKSILKPSKVNKPQTSGGIPPPPPIMPTLKPVGERRKTRTLPPVETDPRDQLLDSIRNFGGLKSLKKISK